VHTDRPREWTADDAQLIDSVAQELRGAIAQAEAFEQQRAVVVELERLSRAKSDFVSIVSHEFRTPLTGIQGFSEMMQSEDLTLDEMREYAGDINKDAHRLNRMITEMLDLDKMESGRMELHHEAVDLNAIVGEAADRVRPNAPTHPVSIRLDPLVGEVSGDRDKLTQVMANLLSNAVKYSPNGGEIVVSTRVEGSTVHIVVRDHGMGIPKAALETIFERYGRVESLATRHIQGTGLGLPIVRQIVQLHGGAVWVESNVGEGSVFHVTLPRGVAGRAEPVEAAS
jgi:signal transduction histidine kinase